LLSLTSGGRKKK